jgi:hypothetical protein
MTTVFFYPVVPLHSSYFRYQVLSTRSLSSIVVIAYVTPVAQLPRITYGFHPS